MNKSEMLNTHNGYDTMNKSEILNTHNSQELCKIKFGLTNNVFATSSTHSK